MYIDRITIKNIRSIKSLEWKIDQGQQAGWHVILGNNGSGKSTLLRSIALALTGPNDALALRQNWHGWMREGRGHSSSSIELDLSHNSHLDRFSGETSDQLNNLLRVRIFLLERNQNIRLDTFMRETEIHPERYIWGGNSGWFSAAFGPFRRFTGGNKDYDQLFYSHPRLAAHLSVFGEDVALTECLQWLQALKFKQLENDPEGDLLDSIVEFVNQAGFLPHQTHLDRISSNGVEFIDGNGCKLPVEDLSDGYRSILSLTFELIRQLARVYGSDSIFDPDDPTKIVPPGVVLIDEIDAHLHPTWQRRIGVWFREHFPNLQFIVTTHSPLVCQAATVGTVWRLPKPGSGDTGGMVTGQELDRLLYGNVLDAYGTEAFGSEVTRSEEAKKRLRRLAELNRKELHGNLTSNERQEQETLRATMPTSAHQVG